ncbi:hypothetical protein [Paraburkholderia sp. LEh10]|uniref:hypothetical protein n=1 Tax=Paraburkholderia sp. LEh10 TaxID=2821353 RepID=UPI001FD7E6E5|nr:hypothetical protein [Paraburkholderia sp. LEh10]
MFNEDQHNATALIIFDAAQSHLPALAAITRRTCHFRADLPVMMIGRSWNCRAVIEALDAGVDEIAIATAGVDEIMARAQRLIVRRHRSQAIDRLTVAGYTIDRTARTVRFRDRCVWLTARELSLAWLLVMSPRNLMSREQLAAAVWGKGAELAGRVARAAHLQASLEARARRSKWTAAANRLWPWLSLHAEVTYCQ